MNTQTTHTPGPWRTADSDSLGMPTIKDCGAAPITIALMDVRYPHLIAPETRLANARLIAAAPELLEALRLLLHGAKQLQAKGIIQPQLNGGVILADAIIAKVEGK